VDTSVFFTSIFAVVSHKLIALKYTSNLDILMYISDADDRSEDAVYTVHGCCAVAECKCKLFRCLAGDI